MQSSIVPSPVPRHHEIPHIFVLYRIDKDLRKSWRDMIPVYCYCWSCGFTLSILLKIGWSNEVIFALYHGCITIFVFIFILRCDTGILVCSTGFLDIDTIPESRVSTLLQTCLRETYLDSICNSSLVKTSDSFCPLVCML
jgi:hypothetical protein